jgi:hypothetical protein
MTLKINASSLLKHHYLLVRSDGVHYYESSGFASAKRFRFSDIACILMSPDNILSLQVGKEIFSIPTDPNNAKHQTVIATLVQEVKRSGSAWGADAQ